MFTTIRKNLSVFILAAIVVLALFLRLYKLSQIPPSLSWDEVAVGYNAYSITHFGMDEWGKRFPLVFKSFEDYKHPVHIYTTAISVGLLGLKDFSVRFPVALFGVLNVILIFFLAKALFKSDLVGIVASIILAVSPYNLQFSRFNHELNFAVFWFMLGLILFYKGLGKNYRYLPLSFASFGVSLLSYHSAKIVVPPIMLLLIALYFQKLKAVKKQFLVSLGILGVFALITTTNPQLLGLARLKQTGIAAAGYTEKFKVAFKQYALHFEPQYLFISGDKNARHSIQTVGEFYKVDAPFLVLGVIFLIWQLVGKKSKEALVILSWALLAPIPSAAVNEAPHAARAMFMTGSWHLIIALGVGGLAGITRKPSFKAFVIGGYLLALGILFGQYLLDYYTEYSAKYAIEWQYGMKQVVEYLKGDKKVGAVYATNIRQQPYIFFLNYLKTPTDQFLKTVDYNSTSSRSFSTVSSFGKYHFMDDLDFAYSYPAYGIYYVLTPPEYTGLFYKKDFEVKSLVKYPDGSDAFYIVTAK